MKKVVKRSYQLDESTDTRKDEQLMVFVRYEDETDNWHQHLQCWGQLLTKKASSRKTVSASILMALLQCLVLDKGSLHKSNESIPTWNPLPCAP